MKPKHFCTIASIRGGFSIRCDPETLAAIYGMAMLKKGLCFRAPTECDLRVINAFSLFRDKAKRASDSSLS